MMRFEARGLKPHGGDFMRSSDLVEGQVYFRVSFLEREMLIPELVPLVFIGRDLHPGSPGVYFQDAASYFAGDRYDPNDSWVAVTSQADMPARVDRSRDTWFEMEAHGEYMSVYEFEKGLDELLRCSLRRNGSPRDKSCGR